MSGEALRLVLPNDVAFTGTAVMAFLTALAWRSEMGAPLAFPQPFVADPPAYLVVPMNEGISYPVDDATIRPMHLVGAEQAHEAAQKPVQRHVIQRQMPRRPTDLGVRREWIEMDLRQALPGPAAE